MLGFATFAITMYFLSLGNEQPAWGMKYLACVFTTISLIYTMVIVKLNLSMAKIEGDFSNEILSINYQFVVFLVSNGTRALFCVSYLIPRLRMEPYTAALFVSLNYSFVNVLPIFIVLY